MVTLSEQNLLKNAEFKQEIAKLFLKFNKFSLDLILLSEYLMQKKFFLVKDEFKDYTLDELKKLGKKMDQNFKSGVNHLIERCKNLSYFPDFEAELTGFKAEQALL